MNKLILIMIDGISAQCFADKRRLLPHLDRLARSGTQIEALTPEVCGTSMPGRTSIITGTSPAQHGIYGNYIWDGREFRWANPNDVRVPTLATYAKQAGRDVAGIGYGIVKPGDCNLYKAPWWVNEMMMRARDDEPHPADLVWRDAGRDHDPEGRLAALAGQGLNLQVIDPNVPLADAPDSKLALGQLADHQLLDVAAGLACSERAPDLILMELGIPDYYLHRYGADHPLTEGALRTADAQVGALLERLRQVGRLQDYNFCILSDHGHAPMPRALYCDRLLGEGVRWSSEGGMLLVAPRDAAEAHTVEARLAEFGIERWNNDHLPVDQRDQLLTFAAPEGSEISFEHSRHGPGAGQAGLWGGSKYRSNHGWRPGSAVDYRFCLFAGPRVPQQQLAFGTCDQVAPTLAALLDLATPWQPAPLFSPLPIAAAGARRPAGR